MDRERLQLLNLGCGCHYHRAWKNVDFVSHSCDVVQRDLRQGIGETDNQYDMVYHSHVLEHFSQQEGRQFLQDCFRVLKPGGILRVAVPDLEQICRLYLQALEDAWSSESLAVNVAETCGRYQWMKMELLDQMTRHQSGGGMGPYMVQASGPLLRFIDQRLGREVQYAQTANHSIPKPARLGWRERWARKTLKWLMGKSAVRQWEVGRFREGGEVHRWMYDRFSLRTLCHELGFESFQVQGPTESFLESFSTYELDTIDGRVRKPDSLFIECRKPRSCVANRRAA